MKLPMKTLAITTFALILLMCSALNGLAQRKLILTPRHGSSVKLSYGARSVTIDLDEALSGTNSMPGNPPHIYKVLFTAEKGGFLYLVAKVRSHSPISNPMGPCGGDRPESMLWIRVDKKLKDHELESEIYRSCSYNYYDSVVKITKSGLTIKYGGKKPKELIYNNFEPEKGFVLGEFLAHPELKGA